MRQKFLLAVAMVAICFLGSSPLLGADARVDRDVVYGMVSGLALLMDVYRPQDSNGHAVLFVWGSGWHAPSGYNANQLKSRGPFPALTDGGYTVFLINHRAAPRFRYPDAVEDAARAVRFIRHHASAYAIDPDRIGAVGGSSGGHLVSLLGAMDGDGDPDDPDPVNCQSAKVQCVVAMAAPFELSQMDEGKGATFLASFMGIPIPSVRQDASAGKLYAQASPTHHLTPGDPPFLIIHGDKDETVPFRQAEIMVAALSEKQIPHRFVHVPNGSHGVLPLILRNSSLPTKQGRFQMSALVGWFDEHLQAQ